MPQKTRRFENLHTQEGAHLHTYTHVETSHGLTTTRTLQAHLTDYIMARNRSGLSIPIAARKYKNTGDHLSDAVRHHESLTRSRIR